MIPSSVQPPGVVPSQRFVGVIDANHFQALVTALACQPDGDIVLLVMTGPQATVSAIVAHLHVGKTRRPATFEAARDEVWHGPQQLYRMTSEGLGSGRIASAVEPTTQMNVAMLAHAANLVYCCAHPIPQPVEPAEPPSASPTSPRTRLASPRQTRLLPPPRFLLATEGAAHPDWQTLTGMLRSLWLPFPLAYAPAIWEAATHWRFELHEGEATHLNREREHMLIEPVAHLLGIQAWQVLPSPRHWHALLERTTRRLFPSGL